MMDNPHILHPDLIEQHPHKTHAHQLNTQTQRYHARNGDQHADQPLHPTSYRCEVVRDGQHHQPKEQLRPIARQIQRVPKIDLEIDVATALREQGEDGDSNEVPENVPEATQLDEPHDQKHGDVQFDDVLECDLETVPFVAHVGGEVGEGDEQAVHEPEDVEQHEGFVVQVALLLLHQYNQNK